MRTLKLHVIVILFIMQPIFSQDFESHEKFPAISTATEKPHAHWATKLKNLMEYKTSKLTKGKRDFFTSRGWGAGGIPFMDQLYTPFSHPKFNKLTSAKAKPYPLALPLRSSAKFANKKHEELPEKQTIKELDNSRSESNQEDQHSYMPQFFLSYGWGPNGEK